MHTGIRDSASKFAAVFFMAFLVVIWLLFVLNKAEPVFAGGLINVTSLEDVIADDGYCTLREAVRAVNTGSVSGLTPGECNGSFVGEKEIYLPAGTYSITIPGYSENAALTGDLDLLADVTIKGPPGTTSAAVVDVQVEDRAFEIFSGVQVTMTHIRIQNGDEGNGWGGGGIRNAGELSLSYAELAYNHSTTSGGGLVNVPGASAVVDQVLFYANLVGLNGGAISNVGILTMTNSSLLGDWSGSNGGGIYNSGGGDAFLEAVSIVYEEAEGNGGGVFNTGSLSLEESLLYDNETAFNGGGIYNNGVITVTNVTISGNSADFGKGGGLYADDSLSSFLNVTMVGNTSPGGASFYRDLGVVNVQNTIISATDDNCNLQLTSLGNNLENRNDCGLIGSNDQVSTDPQIGELRNNGGNTYTHALLPGSPALDQGDDSACPVIDQRFFWRPVGSHCDIGAFELELSTYLPLVLKNFASP